MTKKKEEKSTKKTKKVEEKITKEETPKTVYVERNNGFNTFEVIVIIVVSVLFGILVGYLLSLGKNKVEGTEISPELKDFIVTYNNILDNYYDKVSEKELVNGAISGMVSSLEDPYTMYMNDENTDEFNTTVDGYFIGLGITIDWSDGTNKIINVDKKGKAYKKLKEGDIIIRINDKDVTNRTGLEVAEYVQESKNKVKVTVKREDKEKNYNIEKTKIEIQSVSSEILDDNIGYIYIDNIASNTYKQFKRELTKLEKKDIDSLIIDVRYNPGGHLKQTKQILDLFFDKNTILYQVGTRNKITKVKAIDSEKRDYPVVILTNSNSASASEILAASFQENYKNATIVGEITYGKGTVQKVVDLHNGSSVKYTSEKWLTPKGNSINGIGVKPDVEIERTEEYVKNPTRENDTQLTKAIEVIKTKKESK